jgi:hypothetical protein
MSKTKDLLNLAESWAGAAGTTLFFFPTGECRAVEHLMGFHDGKAALLACALELRYALRSEPDYEQALQELGLEPIYKEVSHG